MNELIHLAGAIALLLWAIRMVRTGFERAYGKRLENAIRLMTRRRLQASVLGAFAAAALQSGTAVVLLAAGFSATGALALIPALSLAVGAEIGSSLVALLLSFDLSMLSPVLILAGFISFQKANNRTFKYWGRICMGLGILLLALSLIAGATTNLRSGNGILFLTDILAHDAMLTLLIVALFTWLVHSSLAVILIIAHLASDGAISLDMSLMMILGANLGGALPALSAGWSMNQKARLVVWGNLLIRLGTVCIGLLLYMAQQNGWLSLPSLGLSSPMIFHVFINSVNGALFLLLLPACAPLLTKFSTPDAEEDPANIRIKSVHLSPEDIKHPIRAMANVTNETLRIAEIAYQMLEKTPDAFTDAKHIAKVKLLDDDIDRIHREVTYYLAAIENMKSTSDDHVRWQDAFNFVTNLEHVGDIIDASLMVLARKKHKGKVEFSEFGKHELATLFDELLEIFRLSQAVYVSQNPDLARELVDAKHVYRNKIILCREQHTHRLRDQIPESLASSQIHMDVLRDLQRICSLLVATAYPIIKRD